MLDYRCDSCNVHMLRPGAMMYSPPKHGVPQFTRTVTTFHLCHSCWKSFMLFLETAQAKKKNDEKDKIQRRLIDGRKS
jgi:hypothetical protein